MEFVLPCVVLGQLLSFLLLWCLLPLIEWRLWGEWWWRTEAALDSFLTHSFHASTAPSKKEPSVPWGQYSDFAVSWYGTPAGHVWPATLVQSASLGSQPIAWILQEAGDTVSVASPTRGVVTLPDFSFHSLSFDHFLLFYSLHWILPAQLCLAPFTATNSGSACFLACSLAVIRDYQRHFFVAAHESLSSQSELSHLSASSFKWLFFFSNPSSREGWYSHACVHMQSISMCVCVCHSVSATHPLHPLSLSLPYSTSDPLLPFRSGYSSS